jgi:hypothetical protein
MGKYTSGLLVASVIMLSILSTTCGKRPSGSTANPNCQGSGCVIWSTTKADFCQQFTPKPPNEAFQVTPKDYHFNLPISVFYQVIQTNASGVSNPPLAEQQWLIPTSQGSIIPICQAAQLGTTEIYTQTIKVNCETNRPLPNGSTSADCTAAELTNFIVNSFAGNFTREVASRMARKLLPLNAIRVDAGESDSKNYSSKPSRKQIVWAPSALSPGVEADCTSVCDNDTAICIHVSSTELSSGMLNLINGWKPGASISKGTAATTLGIKDQCQRSSTVIDAKGTISNTGTQDCAVPMDFQGQPVFVIVPNEIAGQSTIGAKNRQVDFLATKEFQLELPTDLNVYGGPILYISEPTGPNRRVIDLRTPTACVRVHEH